MKKTIYAFIISSCLTIAAIHAAHAQAGSLDPSFGTGGIVTADFESLGEIGFSVAIQNDGKIVVAGESYNGTDPDFILARYNNDGTVDSTFSSDGEVSTDFGSGEDVGYSVAIQSDDKIVVAGYTYNGTNYDFALVRYNSDGSLDVTFDSDGKVTMAIGSGDDVGVSVAIQSDGKIVVAGFSDNGVNYDFALVRYNSDGVLDNTFDSDGKVTTSIGSFDDSGISCTIQSDGKIVVAGESFNGSNSDFALARYNSDGTLDNTFDSDGKVTTAIGSDYDGAHSVAIQADGKIVVAGRSYIGSDNDFALARYNSDGALDNTFDSDGKVTTAIGSDDDGGYSVAIQGNGKIVAAGYSINNYSPDFALVRYNSDGSLDVTFDFDGKVTTDVESNYGGLSVAIDTSNGKIVVAGQSDIGPSVVIAIVRYIGDSPLGIAENDIEVNTIHISPNPFSNELLIKGTKDKGEIIISDVMGKEILREKTFDAETKVNTEKLLPGFYLFNYLEENKTASIKLIKF
ncbi:MAG TPA: T9SS type A sorting domain-containing protein [Chitinophagales bacterium]|nr:T9SS type A sorting domain-containing protein [Chitinophagales bacterium]